MNEKISITRGVNEKPVATDLLGQRLEAMTGIKGVAFTGYPLIE